MITFIAADSGFTLELARDIAEGIEVLAITVICIGVIVSIVGGLVEWFRSSADDAFETFKRYIARGLLIGLDLLIAADVIKTVTLEGTVQSAVVLGLLVLIRTFLSWSLVLEVEGVWPWQRRRVSSDEPA